MDRIISTGTCVNFVSHHHKRKGTICDLTSLVADGNVKKTLWVTVIGHFQENCAEKNFRIKFDRKIHTRVQTIIKYCTVTWSVVT